MDKIRIRGGKSLHGTIAVSGAKNAALPLMAACLLTDETLQLSNLPHLADITTLANLLAQLGVSIGMDGHAPNGGHAGRVVSLRAEKLAGTTAVPCLEVTSSSALGSSSARSTGAQSNPEQQSHGYQSCAAAGVAKTRANSSHRMDMAGPRNPRFEACPPNQHPFSASTHSAAERPCLRLRPRCDPIRGWLSPGSARPG